MPATEFNVPRPDGTSGPIKTVADDPADPFRTIAGEEDYLARVEWAVTVSRPNAIHERGFFGNQNSVARPTSQKWNHTVERLKTRLLDSAAVTVTKGPAL